MKKEKRKYTGFINRLVRQAIERLVFLFSILFLINSAASQNVPLGHWEAHFSYLSAQHLLRTDDKIFCASYNGLFSINPADKEIRVLSKADGLNGNGISSMGYDSSNHTILLAYRTGEMDLALLDDHSEPAEITPWPIFNHNSGLPENKHIRNIRFHKNLAYLATNFGIVVLDTKLRQVGETYRYIGKEGGEVNVKDVAFTSDSLYALTDQGVLASSMHPSVNRQYFANWKLLLTPSLVSAIVSLDHVLYGGLPGKGVFKFTRGVWTMIYSSHSNYYSFNRSDNGLTVTMEKSVVHIPATGQSEVFQSDLFSSLKETIFTGSGKVWTADENNGLLSNADGAFGRYSPAEQDTTIAPRSDSTVADWNGMIWTRLPAYLGGGISVKNKTTNQERFLNTTAGSGGLPSSTINSLATDQEGYVWFASDKGVGYFLPDEILSQSRPNAILPIFGQRRLFSSEKCTALAIEPGNRKWIGTLNGLYLFNTDGTELLVHFNTDNSPMPTNIVTALQFESETGMLLVDTPNGMVSYRSDATVSADNFSSVTIFPNPVRPGYGGQVGFKGLAENSTLKITQLSGRLVYETKSQGGTASWNLHDYTGSRAKGGIYTILIITRDGQQKFAGKLAIID